MIKELQFIPWKRFENLIMNFNEQCHTRNNLMIMIKNLE
jgi:hypothetical protein